MGGVYHIKTQLCLLVEKLDKCWLTNCIWYSLPDLLESKYGFIIMSVVPTLNIPDLKLTPCVFRSLTQLSWLETRNHPNF